jgi:hypothetical protein
MHEFNPAPAYCARTLALAMTAFSSLSAWAVDTEFAIRWHSRQGGPKSAAEAIEKLKLSKDKNEDKIKTNRERYKIQYYEPIGLTGIPCAADLILRKRENLDSGEAELMVKYRSSRDLSEFAADEGKRCAPVWKGFKPEDKYETDISVAGPDMFTRVHSYSCTLDSKEQPDFPKSLKGRIAGKPRVMSRTELKGLENLSKLKFDEWTEAGKDMLIEVSWKGQDTGASLDTFNAKVALPLIQLGVQPIARNKSATKKAGENPDSCASVK